MQSGPLSDSWLILPPASDRSARNHTPHRSIYPDDCETVLGECWHWSLFAAAAGLHFAFLYVTSIGSTIFGYGLARRCVGMSIFKLAAFGLALTGLLSFILLMIAEHAPGIDLHGLAVASNGVLLFGSLCILIIGVGILKGRQEFVVEEEMA